VRGRDGVGDAFNQTGLGRTGLRKTIKGLALVKAVHFDGIFDRGTVAVDAQGPVVTLGYRNHAAIDLRRERPVDVQLRFAGSLAFRQRRIIQRQSERRA
jgi:hypothetical protein